MKIKHEDIVESNEHILVSYYKLNKLAYVNNLVYINTLIKS